MLDPQLLLLLAAQCAPQVAPATLLAVTRAESGLDPLAIGVNGVNVTRPRPRTRAAAVHAAKTLVAKGHDIDLGLGQINVRNLRRLGLSLETAFDPCRNLAAAGAILGEGYARGRAAHGPGQAALRVALSVYNTGDPRRGFTNGYVARVLAHAGSAPPEPDPPPPAPMAPPSPPPAWDVFGRAAAARAQPVTSNAGAIP